LSVHPIRARMEQLVWMVPTFIRARVKMDIPVFIAILV